MIRARFILPAALIAVFAPTAASAHTGIGGGFGLIDGAVHPFLGLDHLVAMIAIGFWAAQLGGRARWQVPAAFVGTMALAGGLALAGLAIPLVEWGVAASVLILGLVIAARTHLAVPLAMAVAGAFAAFHGFAHGAEIPAAANPVFYAAGFVAATAALHGIGFGFGALARGAWAVQLGGGAVAAAGAVLLIAA